MIFKVYKKRGEHVREVHVAEGGDIFVFFIGHVG